MNHRGVTVVELVLVLLILSITAGVFYGLIREMSESGMLIMGRKESYQQAKDALKRMADEIRYNMKGGPNHNFGVVTGGLWESTATHPCTDSRFTFFPDLTQNQVAPTRRVRFVWDNYSGERLHSGWYLQRQEANDETVGTVSVLAGAPDSTKGILTVKYYDDALGTEIDPGGAGSNNLTHAEAQRVTRIVLVLTLQQWQERVTLSESFFVRQEGPPPEEAGWL